MGPLRFVFGLHLHQPVGNFDQVFQQHLDDVYRPLLEGVLRVASGMKVVQAGSLHAYLAYVTILVVSLVLMVWWAS